MNETNEVMKQETGVTISPNLQNLEGLTSALEAFAPRIQFNYGQSKAVTEHGLPSGEFCKVVGKEFIKIGPTLDIQVLHARSLAIDFNDEDNVIRCYDQALDDKGKPTGEFKRIQEIAKSGAPNCGCQAGVDFLIWYNGEYYTFFCGNRSLEYVASILLGMLVVGNPITTPMCKLGVTDVPKRGKKPAYKTPAVQESQASIPEHDIDKLNKIIYNFENPPKPEVAEEVDVKKDKKSRR
jgi:hypothetical protein